RHLPRNHRTRTHRRAGAHGHRRDQHHVRADRGVVADDGAVLVGAVVVGGDGARADVNLAPDRAVADVREMVHLARFGDVGLLDFDEIADVHVVGEPGARAQPGERTDAAIGADLRFLDNTVRQYFRSRADRAVADHVVRSDAYPVRKRHSSFEDDIDVDLDIAAARERAAHIEPLRVTQRHALIEELSRVVSLIRPFQVGELAFAVYAEDLPGRARLARHDLDALRDRHGDDVGQIVFALRVAVLQAREPPGEQARRGGQDAGVDLAYRRLLGGRVLLFDDALDLAQRMTHDAAVAARVGKLRGKQRDARRPALRKQIAQRLRARERDIAVEHQYQRILGDARQRLLHGMARAELFGLVDPGNRLSFERIHYLLSSVTVDDMDGARGKRPRGVEHVTQQGFAGEPMQHFRQSRMHALTLTGSENNDFEVARHGVAEVMIAPPKRRGIPSRARPRKALFLAAQLANGGQLRGDGRELGLDRRDFLLVRGIAPGFLGALQRLGRLGLVQVLAAHGRVREHRHAARLYLEEPPRDEHQFLVLLTGELEPHRARLDARQ